MTDVAVAWTAGTLAVTLTTSSWMMFCEDSDGKSLERAIEVAYRTYAPLHNANVVGNVEGCGWVFY